MTALDPFSGWQKAFNPTRDKCKLEGYHSVINGIKYVTDNLSKLPNNLVPYKAIQKENETHLAFHGEMSPYSNFHRSPFVINNHQFHLAEQWIQYTKALLFRNSFTAS